MSEVIRGRVKKSKGKRAKIFLKDGFKFEGIITNIDDTWLELLDQKISAYKIIRIEDISDLDVYGEEGK